jgi:dihydropteroate synthase
MFLLYLCRKEVLQMFHKTLNIKGTLVPLDRPIVMGILNVTPDSFYADSRKQTESAISERIETILSEGGKIIDIGGYSSRPNAIDISPEEELKRLAFALKIIQTHYPQTIVSVDTFRASVARQVVEDFGAAIINDISGGQIDNAMFETVARLHVPYILMHMRGTPQTMQQYTEYTNIMEEILLYFANKVNQLRQMGVNDIILDPGFGFSKTVDQNYILMQHLEDFHELELPLLVGISRKSMIFKYLDKTASDSLNGTTVLNTYALLKGAHILRVHDVKEAVEAIKIVDKLTKENGLCCG